MMIMMMEGGKGGGGGGRDRGSGTSRFSIVLTEVHSVTNQLCE